MTEPEYVTITEAAHLLRVSRWTVRRRIAEGALTAHTSPANRRVKLLRRVDVERLLTPTIATPAAIRMEHTEGDQHV